MNNLPGHVVRRTDGEPAADLTEHRVVHRGIQVDLRRLASAATELAPLSVQHDDRWHAFENYLTAVVDTTKSHLRVDNGSLSELVAGLTGASSARGADPTSQLIGLLDRARDTASANGGPPAGPVGAQLAMLLGRAERIARALFGEQERLLFPLILEYVRAVDHRWVQEQFRAELPAGLLAFVVPWTVRHATAEELPALNDPALCVTYRIFGQRFRATESLLFE